jgi:hypothetical protein
MNTKVPDCYRLHPSKALINYFIRKLICYTVYRLYSLQYYDWIFRQYAFHAELLKKRFWTLSVWEDESSLNKFVMMLPHSEVMIRLGPYMKQTKFTYWKIKGQKHRRTGLMPKVVLPGFKTFSLYPYLKKPKVEKKILPAKKFFLLVLLINV